MRLTCKWREGVGGQRWEDSSSYFGFPSLLASNWVPVFQAAALPFPVFNPSSRCAATCLPCVEGMMTKKQCGQCVVGVLAHGQQ